MALLTTPIRLVARNGVGAFVRPCQRITLGFSNWGGSSVGMRKFLTSDLKQIAAEFPEIEFTVTERPSAHPIVRGEYANGREKVVCVRNKDPATIVRKLRLLANTDGRKLIPSFKYKPEVRSLNESVRGVWSPLHVDPLVRHKV